MRESPAARAAPADPAAWLPDFCSPRTALAVLALAELVLLVVLYAPGPDWPTLGRLATGTLFVQWLALCALVSLCVARGRLARLPVATGVAGAYAIVLGILLLGTLLAVTIDRALAFDLTRELGTPQHIALSVLLVGALVTTGALRYFYVQAQWQREIRAQARAQVKALQARIRPHFLFNSMNTIASLVSRRPADAERAVEDLSELFRAALAAGDELSDLGRELDLVQRYLAIEQLRLGSRLALDWRIDDDVPRELPIPALLLQPLAENAVLHGIQPLAAGGTLSFGARREPGVVRIELRNPRNPHPGPRPHGHNIGHDSVRERLRYHFGDRARLDVESGPDFYRCVVTLPQA
ncbi:MAG TPA: sensor histidine kinase [Candidatus Saccharimonadia bacterium]|nr:sensor histidine kinase [Candidatus Saccharimonadia bacterium]